jgi:dolichyl-phosphate-mannose--protein O-mannosyl transferase
VCSIKRGHFGVTLLSVAMMIVVFISVSFLPALISGAIVAIDRR